MDGELLSIIPLVIGYKAIESLLEDVVPKENYWRRSMKTNTKHQITTKQVSPKTTLIFVNGKLAMINSVVDEEYKEILGNAVGGMMEMVMQAGQEEGLRGK